MKRKHLQKIISAFALGLSFASCQKGLSPSEESLLSGATIFKITTTVPAAGAALVSLDQEIEITFDRRIDMASVHASQVEIWTAGGDKLDWHTIQVGGRYTETGSVMKIHPINSVWLPLTQYYVALRGQVPADAAGTPSLAGIRGIDGSYLDPTSFSFTTGTEYKNQVFSGPPVVTAISPGRIVTGGADSSASLGDSFMGATTVVSDNDIKISFSKPVKHFSIDKFGTTLTPEIPRVPIDKVPGIAVGILDARTSLGDFTKSVPDAVKNPGAWSDFKDTILKQQLKGIIHTENSRKLLIFELDKNCAGQPECSYPDNSSVSNIASVVAVIISGFISVDRSLPLANSPTIAGFVHISGYRAGEGYPSVDNGLSNIAGVFRVNP